MQQIEVEELQEPGRYRDFFPFASLPCDPEDARARDGSETVLRILMYSAAGNRLCWGAAAKLMTSQLERRWRRGGGGDADRMGDIRGVPRSPGPPHPATHRPRAEVPPPPPYLASDRPREL